MKRVYNFLIATFIILAFGCTTKEQIAEDTTSKDDPYMDKITSLDPEERLNMFAFNMYKEILKNVDNNLIISPFSISTAMAMTYGGSGGETKDQMSKTLFFDPDIDNFHEEFNNHVKMLEELAGEDLELNIANGLWLQHDYPFLENYIETIQNYYGSVLHEADFKVDQEKEREEINDWVSDKTNQKIDELIDKGVLVEDTRLVIVNAIYFLSNWLEEFDKELTRKRDFHIDEETTVETEFMRKDDTFKYFEDEHAQVLEIPYSGEDFSMMLMLPREDIGLSDFESKLDSKKYKEYVDSLSEKEVNLLFPKFKMRSKANLGDLLIQMGMPQAFSNKADFSRMTSEDDLKIDQVIHEAFIEVDEEGTEAAAATAVSIVVKSARPDEERIIFRADRPFKFFIKDNKTNTILFMGRVMDPAK